MKLENIAIAIDSSGGIGCQNAIAPCKGKNSAFDLEKFKQ